MYSKLWTTLLLVGSIMVAAVMGEIVLRYLGHYGVPMWLIDNAHQVDDPILDWRYLPNSERRVGNVKYTYNSSGFRDEEHMLDNPRMVKRIVVIGDSVTEGYGVHWQSVFSQVVQSQLNNEIEVITIAMGGLNTPQEVHLFEQEGLRYKPELVILNFVLNDCDFYSSIEAARRYRAQKDSEIGLLNIQVSPALKRLLKSSALIYFVKERLENIKGKISETGESDYVASIWKSEKNRRRITGGFHRLKALGEEHQFKVVVVIWPIISDYKAYAYGWIHNWVREAAESKGLWTIDLLPHFKEFPHHQLQLISTDYFHPNALGHRVAAAAFVSWYRSHKR